MRLRVLTGVIATATLLSGCQFTVPGHLYPIQGPEAAQSPPVIYDVSATGAMRDDTGELFGGSITATLANSETCSGSWSPVPTGDNTAGQMSVQWDQVYGPGFFVANVLGNGHFSRTTTLTCSKGDSLNIEFFNPSRLKPGNSKGVAQDSKGNLYKVTF